ncbi:MAG TPA: hypothetical protein VM509_07585, partial [Planctomycetota bacterium]|nr:hypothetical protein [Planctomycetota bacterium]
KRLLEPLAQLPGVSMVLLVAHDGVPVIVRNAGPTAAEGASEVAFAAASAESLAALAAGWLSELERSIGPLSWGSPQRVVLRAARGSLVMTHAPGALLLVIIDPRMSAEEVRLPMEAAVGRMHRLLRSSQESAAPETGSDVGAALPARTENKGHAASRADTGL